MKGLLGRLFRRGKKPDSPAAGLENPYRPIYRSPRRVEDIRPSMKDGEKTKKRKKAGPR